MGNRFSSAKHSIAECDRCGFRFKLKILKRLIIKTKQIDMLVCPQCWDPDHPQLQLGMYPVDDPQGVRDPRPDRSYYTSGPLPDGTLGEGSRVIQWGWNPVGLGHIPIGLLTPNKLWTTTYVGRVTIQTDQEVPAPYLVERASAADSFSAVLTSGPIEVQFSDVFVVNAAIIDANTLTAGTASVNQPPNAYAGINFKTSINPLLVIPNTKVYWEIALDSAASIGPTVTRYSAPGDPAFIISMLSLTSAVFGGNTLILYYDIGAGFQTVSIGTTPVQVGQKVGIALDPVNGKVWFAVNNVWVLSGNPAAGAAPAVSFTPTTNLTPSVSMWSTAADINTALTTSKFKDTALTYAPPTGFVALQTAINP